MKKYIRNTAAALGCASVLQGAWAVFADTAASADSGAAQAIDSPKQIIIASFGFVLLWLAILGGIVFLLAMVRRQQRARIKRYADSLPPAQVDLLTHSGSEVYIDESEDKQRRYVIERRRDGVHQVFLQVADEKDRDGYRPFDTRKHLYRSLEKAQEFGAGYLDGTGVINPPRRI